jgi:transcriptional regulator with XRE-family HTH domain
MRSNEELLQLKAQAIALRRAGKSVREIKQALGPVGNSTLSWALRGEPPPEWTRRPRAKDAVRAQARELRKKGLDYEEIAAELGVSKSSVSLWVRDMPTPPHLTPEESSKRAVEGMRRYWAAQRPLREAVRGRVVTAAAAEIGKLSGRELLIAGAVAYWCEGAKSKPWRRNDRVAFINSDPGLITLFLCFLELAGVSRDSVTYRLSIHESADLSAAERFWLDVTGAEPGQFRKPTLKRHNPKTVRKNTGDDYHGCLIIAVRLSAVLYQRIEGWAEAIMRGAMQSRQRSVTHLQRTSSRERIRTPVLHTKRACPAD